MAGCLLGIWGGSFLDGGLFLGAGLLGVHANMSAFFYTYVLRCGDEDLYIGSTTDLTTRMQEHRDGKCDNTRKRLPVDLVYYEACRSIDAARQREKQLKTGFGRGYLRKRLAHEWPDPS